MIHIAYRVEERPPAAIASGCDIEPPAELKGLPATLHQLTMGPYGQWVLVWAYPRESRVG